MYIKINDDIDNENQSVTQIDQLEPSEVKTEDQGLDQTVKCSTWMPFEEPSDTVREDESISEPKIEEEKSDDKKWLNQSNEISKDENGVTYSVILQQNTAQGNKYILNKILYRWWHRLGLILPSCLWWKFLRKLY